MSIIASNYKIVPPINYELNLPDGRLSYDYLKSVTVYIEGKGYTEDALYGTRIIGWAGTGIIVKIDTDYIYIVTNNHVTGHSSELDIKAPIVYVLNEQKMEQAEVVANHPVEDVALIRIPSTMKNVRAIVGFATAELQEKVYMVGHNLGTPYIYSEGCLAGYYENYNLFLLASGPGDSGSGIFNTNGELVGLLFAGRMVNFFQMDMNYAIAIDSQIIKQFLKGKI
jgi:S1-C subfamily serine protease